MAWSAKSNEESVSCKCNAGYRDFKCETPINQGKLEITLVSVSGVKDTDGVGRGAPDVFLNTIIKNKTDAIVKKFESDEKSGTSVTYNQKWEVDLDDVTSHSVTVQIRDSDAMLRSRRNTNYDSLASDVSFNLDGKEDQEHTVGINLQPQGSMIYKYRWKKSWNNDEFGPSVQPDFIESSPNGDAGTSEAGNNYDGGSSVALIGNGPLRNFEGECQARTRRRKKLSKCQNTYKTANQGGKVCAEGDGSKMVCDRKEINAWERFNMKEVEGSTTNEIYLMGGHTKKYCADTVAGIECNRNDIGPWEKFTKVDVTTDKVYGFKGGRSGKFCADSGGTGKVVCDRNAMGGWEKFQVRPVDYQPVAIQGGASKDFCSSYQPEGAKEVTSIRCRATEIGTAEDAAEKFVLATIVGLGDKVSIVSKVNDKFCSDNDSGIVCNRDKLGPWERFTREDLKDSKGVLNGYVALKGGKQNKYCTDEGVTITCKANTIGKYEKFKLVTYQI